MKYVKVIFGLCCFPILIISAFAGIWDFVGEFIKEGDLRGLVSMLTLFVVSWGFESYNSTWRHYK